MCYSKRGRFMNCCNQNKLKVTSKLMGMIHDSPGHGCHRKYLFNEESN